MAVFVKAKEHKFSQKQFKDSAILRGQLKFSANKW